MCKETPQYKQRRPASANLLLILYTLYAQKSVVKISISEATKRGVYMECEWFTGIVKLRICHYGYFALDLTQCLLNAQATSIGLDITLMADTRRYLGCYRTCRRSVSGMRPEHPGTQTIDV